MATISWPSATRFSRMVAPILPQPEMIIFIKAVPFKIKKVLNTKRALTNILKPECYYELLYHRIK
jgi:hypothetical protein